MWVAFSHPGTTAGPQSVSLANDVGWGVSGSSLWRQGGGLILYVISPYKFCMRISHTNSCSHSSFCLECAAESTVHYIYIQFKARDSSSTPGWSIGQQLSTRMTAHACARVGSNPRCPSADVPAPMAQRRARAARRIRAGLRCPSADAPAPMPQRPDSVSCSGFLIHTQP